VTDIRDVEKAERIGRSRARLFALQALLFISWQGLFFAGETEDRMRLVDEVRISAWFIWVIVLLLLLATGGGLMRSRSVRALLNDELTRANRARAYAAGFWAAMVSAIGLTIVDMLDRVHTREAIHLILSAAIASALVTFAARERRGARGGESRS
jgi:hypothetical protein